MTQSTWLPVVTAGYDTVMGDVTELRRLVIPAHLPVAAVRLPIRSCIWRIGRNALVRWPKPLNPVL